MPVTNTWYATYKTQIEKIIYDLNVLKARSDSSKDNIKYNEITFLMRGMMAEISRLQTENDDLKREISTLRQ